MATKDEGKFVEELNTAWTEYRRKFHAKERGLDAAFQTYMVALDAYTKFLKDRRLKGDGPS